MKKAVPVAAVIVILQVLVTQEPMSMAISYPKYYYFEDFSIVVKPVSKSWRNKYFLINVLQEVKFYVGHQVH